MKTRDSPEKVTQLPPAPAPTSRGANRWPLSEGALDGARGQVTRLRRGDPAGDPPQGAARTPRRRSFLHGAAAPLLAALVMGVFAFLRGRKGDSFEDYRGLLVALAVVAFLVISRLGKRKTSRGAGRDGGAGA